MSLSENENRIFERVALLIGAAAGVDPSEVDIDAKITAKFQLDSLDAVDLLLAINEEFQVELEDNDLSALSTPREIIARIIALQSGMAAMGVTNG